MKTEQILSTHSSSLVALDDGDLDSVAGGRFRGFGNISNFSNSVDIANAVLVADNGSDISFSISQSIQAG